MKFLCLKVFADIVMQYLADDRAKDRQKRSKLLTEMIISDFLPIWTSLVKESEPIPLFALKLLSAISDSSQDYIAVI